MVRFRGVGWLEMKLLVIASLCSTVLGVFRKLQDDGKYVEVLINEESPVTGTRWAELDFGALAPSDLDRMPGPAFSLISKQQAAHGIAALSPYVIPADLAGSYELLRRAANGNPPMVCIFPGRSVQTDDAK